MRMRFIIPAVLVLLIIFGGTVIVLRARNAANAPADTTQPVVSPAVNPDPTPAPDTDSGTIVSTFVPDPAAGNEQKDDHIVTGHASSKIMSALPDYTGHNMPSEKELRRQIAAAQSLQQ